jgi:transcriptional regulator with XRE-family HTH domain
MRRPVGLRELARRIGVSPSFISQIERGGATPSVGTLYAIVQELDVSLDSLFSSQPVESATEDDPAASSDDDDLIDDDLITPRGVEASETTELEPVHAATPRRTPSNALIMRGDGRTSIQLGSGVRWERLPHRPEQDVDFLFAVYEPGGASAEAPLMIRHAGTEYGYVVQGRLGIAVEFETFELGPGDSISFDSTTPHRLWTIGSEPVHAVWFVVGRSGDHRTLPA